MKWLKELYYKVFKNSSLKSRSVTRATFLYYYIIFGAMGGLFYFITALIYDLPKHWALSPLYLLVVFVSLKLLYANKSVIWMYISDMDRGRLLNYLHTDTHYEDAHKGELINWVYPKRKTIRAEIKAEIQKKLYEGEKLTKDEKIKDKRKVAKCPQQIKDGFNEALLVHVLIYANDNIKPLDDELMEIMELTPERMHAFDLKREYNKAGGDEYSKYLEIGKRRANELKG